MGKILELAEQLWQGTVDTFQYHPFNEPFGIEKLADATWFVKGFSNTIVVETSNGLILIDPAASFEVDSKYKKIREQLKQPVQTVVFTHGHGAGEA